jgi:predicted HTH transcriptional regulator
MSVLIMAAISLNSFLFNLTAHLNQAHERQHRFEAMNTAVAGVLAALEAASLNERCEHALYISLLGGTVTRARYMAALAENGEHISEQSATRDLAALDRAGLLNAQGDRRGRFYTRSDMVRQIGLDAGLGYAWKDSNPFV